MSFQILRTAKLTSKSAISKSAGHNFRENETLNANTSLTPSNSHLGARSSAEVMAKINSRLEEAAKMNKSGKLRKNAVLAIEYLITFSPEFKNESSKEQQNQYFKDAMRWLQEKHGAENVVSASVHRDETTPHLCAYVVPIDERGKLNCRSFLGGQELMSEMQTDFHEKVAKKQGLERGLSGSKADHIPIKQYYKNVNSPVPKVKTEIPQVPEPTILEIALEAFDFKTKHSKEKELAEQAKQQRAKEIKARQESYFAKAKQYDMIKASEKAIRADLSQSKEKVRALSARMRELPLKDVLEAFGATNDSKDKNNFKSEVGRISLDGQKFFNHDLGAGGGGAIDLVMHLHQSDYKTALSTLANRFGSGDAAAAVASHAEMAVAEAVKTVAPVKSTLPDDSPNNWTTVKDWLTGLRKIPGKVVDEFRSKGLLRADGRGNVLFVNQNQSGGEIRGKGQNFKGYRGKRGLFVVDRSPEKSVLVVESGTDAMAFCSQDQRFGKVVSTGGDFGEATINELKALKAEGYRIVIGTDNDQSGDAKFKLLAKELGLQSEHRMKPQGRDWQDDMRATQANAVDRGAPVHLDQQRQQEALAMRP